MMGDGRGRMKENLEILRLIEKKAVFLQIKYHLYFEKSYDSKMTRRRSGISLLWTCVVY